MADQNAFERFVLSLHDSMLDDTNWPVTSALIDEACGLTGNTMMVGEGPRDDRRVQFVGLYQRGERRHDLEREYLTTYHPIDERVPRIRQLPDSRLVHVNDQYTPEELKTSPVYNDALLRAGHQNSLAVRMDGPDGSDIAMNLGDPVAGSDWGSPQLKMIARILPQIRQFVRVRQALVRTEARNATATSLLENTRVGIVHLDRHGKILEVNDRARGILRRADGLSDRDGALRASTPADQIRLERLLAQALPTSATIPLSGSMLLRRSSASHPFAVHAKPVRAPQPDYGARHVVALVLVVEPGRRQRVAPDLVATTLGLTPRESQVAVWLAEGKSVREIAEVAGLTTNAVHWHLKQIYQKKSISGQVDLVRLVLSVAEVA
ncbi:MAG: helix-turn-helix transcriptional regulator [Acidobacteria bacterium]|nr:helix-turn-helix transcriptional regulator [Acidobacteriota bacterium]MYD69474.1 helix-turn-helix transcriptional regulator [Acidobacteriota bacterium]MYJ04158.1 helix-turn-helix transcriptional regulator [Acidobacteriota bacterium]